MSSKHNNHNSIPTNNSGGFKAAQLRYKRRSGHDPSHVDDSVLDFHRLSSVSSSEVAWNDQVFSCSLAALQRSDYDDDLYRGPLYGLKSCPGLVYAPQALSPREQLELAYLALTKYCEPPLGVTNIDLLPPKPNEEDNTGETTMWDLWKRKQQQQHQKGGADASSNQSSNKRTKKPKKYRSLDKLSWSTMGYHYDWTARAYREEAKSPMPEELAQLACFFAKTCLTVLDPTNKCTDGGSATGNVTAGIQKFTSSACIVNYYHIKSIMGGHRDDLELSFDKPVVSMSLGLPAIFLLGGHTKEDDFVVPILIRPGDVVMMGGDCRLRYHGVARIVIPDEESSSTVKLCCSNGKHEHSIYSLLPTSVCDSSGVEEGNKQNDSVPSSSDEEAAAVEKFLSTHRININVRQVLPDGVDRIPEA